MTLYTNMWVCQHYMISILTMTGVCIFCIACAFYTVHLRLQALKRFDPERAKQLLCGAHYLIQSTFKGVKLPVQVNADDYDDEFEKRDACILDVRNVRAFRMLETKLAEHIATLDNL